MRSINKLLFLSHSLTAAFSLECAMIVERVGMENYYTGGG